jgi:Asp-tRNA(Asn)/Glu-tRNA(Gln) amidotransferase A subunit family amidase
MTWSLSDAAIGLSVIAGKDHNDNFTLAQPPIVPDYTKALKKDALNLQFADPTVVSSDCNDNKIRFTLSIIYEIQRSTL